MRTDEQVRHAIIDRLDEVINDLQNLLENNCCNSCNSCEYQYLCIRDNDIDRYRPPCEQGVK